MTDRWARAEERFRQREADRRYRRDDRAWGGQNSRDNRGKTNRVVGREQDAWDDYEDDTTVIPRYTDEMDDQPPPAPAPRSRERRDAPRPRVGRREPVDDDEPEGRRRSKSPQRSRRSRAASRKAKERKRRRRTLWLVAGVFVLLFAGAAVFAGMKLIKSLGSPEDYAAGGQPGPLVVVQVHDGDTSQQIAATMKDRGVVASTGAFFEAAVRNSNMNSVQPGFYAIPSKIPAAQAVTQLLGKQARVGNLVIPEGRLLHDQYEVGGSGRRTDGIYRMMAAASCIGTGPTQKCVTYEQLDAAGANVDLAALGVPAWAAQGVKDCPDRTRQLEGLIAAGTLDFDPSGTPEQMLRQVVTASAKNYESTGLLQSGGETKLTPYQTLIAASLVEREAKPQDMGKVARVIVNRLRVPQMLQFDSTVNYALDRTEVQTTDADRAAETPWNTYAKTGLPATPISAPSLNALRAMENPEAGSWLYFVTVDKQGTTLFTDDYKQHQRYIQQAQASGILDSGR